YIDGSAMGSTSPCRLDQTTLERHGAEMLHGAGLDAISGMDKLTRLRALQSEFDDILREREKTPHATHPGLVEQAERGGREIHYLASQPFLSVNVGVATID